MNPGTAWRSTTHWIALGILCVVLGSAKLGQAAGLVVQSPPQHTGPAREPTPRTAAPPAAKPQGTNNAYAQPGHLAQWMQSHGSLTLDQQQKALAAEPGFRQLQPEVQQRIHDRLTQLNQMTPAQRQRTLERTEQMERLTQPQRLQVRSALSALGSLPEDRRRFVARTFRQLRDLPELQRNAYLNTAQVRSQFSDQELGVLNNLFAAEPYLPSPPAQAQR